MNKLRLLTLILLCPLPWASAAPAAETYLSRLQDDIPILPASGVIQAAVFWTIASERARITP